MSDLRDYRAAYQRAVDLCEEWDSDEYCDADVNYGSCARELRAALTPPPEPAETDASEGGA